MFAHSPRYSPLWRGRQDQALEAAGPLYPHKGGRAKGMVMLCHLPPGPRPWNGDAHS